ncbi:Glycoside hydrolase family 18 protein [Mycena venus]|uniref:Glycoside hydrolase family 18 protein n=1 Tax=Mycena venus TaxID=2733690 RepID=A0A8H7CEX4_9AGAR|nr:Glycoside hydrolase family 18 protein [Mycena venus]
MVHLRTVYSVFAAGIGLLSSMPKVAAADCTVHTVVSGDTCSAIAQAAKITLAQLQSFNPNADCSNLQLGEKLCVTSGTIPGQPQQNPNGTCATYTIVSMDSCSTLALKFSITVAEIEQWNTKTWKWQGCANLQIGEVICVSTGAPPPIPIDPNQQCGIQTVGNVTCPLNACCSAFGFCGLTDEFCLTTGSNPCQSNCIEPSLPSCTSGKLSRKIGYYQGSAVKRVAGCNPVSPAQLDLKGYTHVHYAFATISQGLEIQITDDDNGPLQDLVNRKKDVTGLKVLIAIGGWDFSEDDGTKDLFTVMIESSTNRATFINSVKSFLEVWGLDGIDIDFEYPAAIERDAPATATPAGYWFLKGFEINKIASSVSYMNMMSYDYHGDWDVNVTGQAPVTNPHTSILDMEDSVKLYIRAGIDMSIVNLGLAHYARTYHLAAASCVGYNCTMVGGGAAGSCTATPGILSQYEVDKHISGKKPTLDTPSQTYWLDLSGGDLVTFDQADTLAKKTTFAATTCFGGTFEWSLDQPTLTQTTPPPTKTYPAPVTCTSAFTVAKARVSQLLSYFVPPEDGEGGFFVSEPDDMQRLWTDSNKWETIYNYMVITGDKQFDIFNEQVEYPFPDGSSGPNWNNLFKNLGEPASYDDALWTSIMFFKLGDGMGNNQDYYKFGAGILAYVKNNALDTTSKCQPGSGVWWNSDRNYKNTVTNGLFLLANGLAFERLNDNMFRQDALDTWGWLSASGLRGTDGIWRDGISWDSKAQSCSLSGGIYSYNQGTIPAGLGLLYKITGGTNADYLTDAELTINAVFSGAQGLTTNGILREPICDPAPSCNKDRSNGPDRMTFKGLFMKHLMYYIDVVKDVGTGNTHSGPFAAHIWAQFEAVTSSDVSKDDETGDPWFPQDNRYWNGYTDQAGVDAILAAIKYGGCGSAS